MNTQIECSQIDLRYESYRMRNRAVEKRILLSVEQHGIHNPVQGIYSQSRDHRFILLDGFKRYRSTRKLGIEQLPIHVVSDDFVRGFLSLLRNDTSSALTALEQASFLRDLHTEFHLSYSEIARRVERSLSWVSVRINLINTMNTAIREKILHGKFPLRSYMYTLAPFTRVNGKGEDVKQFIDATSNKGYSTRDIETLSRVFFSDDTKVKEQILLGNTDWTLQMLKKETYSAEQTSPSEKIYYALKTCRWHTAEIAKHYHRTPDLFDETRNARIFDFVIHNCKELVTLTGKGKCFDHRR